MLADGLTKTAPGNCPRGQFPGFFGSQIVAEKSEDRCSCFQNGAKMMDHSSLVLMTKGLALLCMAPK
jgi:hypothetical protein